MTMHVATYCPEDNKLRFYPDWDDPEFDKEHLKAAGYRWASKQECYVCPRWTPTAEDAALAYVDDIDDEDYSPTDRAADRAERFSGYRDNRRRDAHSHADTYDSGDTAYGYQTQAKADRAASRRERHKTKALSQWSKAEYWQRRTEGVIANALYRAEPEVRRRRMVGIMADKRKMEKHVAEHRKHYAAFQAVLNMEGLDDTCVPSPPGYVGVDLSQSSPACCAVYKLACDGRYSAEYRHPRIPDCKDSLDDLLQHPTDPITAREAAEMWLAIHYSPDDPAYTGARWLAHYNLRLQYEQTMIDSEGGAAFLDDIKPGDVSNPSAKFQVTKVNKGADGRVVSLSVVNRETWKESNRINVESLASGQFVRPTEEQAAEFKAWQAEKSAKTKAKNAKAPKLINPTREDAERLQVYLNAEYKDEKHHSTPIDATQAAYTSQSKGSYGKCETVMIGERLRPIRYQHYERKTTQRIGVFKVRICKNGWNADRVVILTDKPQHPIPWHLVEEAQANVPRKETHIEAFGKLMDRHREWGTDFCNLPEEEREAAKQLRKDAGYLGWAKVECWNEFNLTDEGKAVYQEYKERFQTVETH